LKINIQLFLRYLLTYVNTFVIIILTDNTLSVNKKMKRGISNMYHVLKLHNTKCIIGNGHHSFITDMTQQYEIDGVQNVYHIKQIARVSTPAERDIYLYRVDDVANGIEYYVSVNHVDIHIDGKRKIEHVYDVIDDTFDADNDFDALIEFARFTVQFTIEFN
jgi:hypothetical protein